MSISLSDGDTTIDLPADLFWSDEFEWSRIDQSADYSLTGALVVQQGEKGSGRPISLLSDGAAWVARSTVEALQAYYDTGDQVFTLSYHGTDYDVQFTRPGGFIARPVQRLANPGPNHFYTVELRLFEVEQ